MHFYCYCVYSGYEFVLLCFFFFKQKTAYEMRISDWSSDVCSSDLLMRVHQYAQEHGLAPTVMTFEPHPRAYFARRGQRPELIPTQISSLQIGRAPCRERLCQYV